VKDDGSAIVIEVSDTGPGIDPDLIKQVFDPFFTTKDVGEGTRLGLSISQNIIEQHHGTITVESKLGVGTTFRIELPIPETVSSI
jgi:two-component system NtrC family sensor kinase